MKRLVSLYLADELVSKLDEVAEKRKTNRSETATYIFNKSIVDGEVDMVEFYMNSLTKMVSELQKQIQNLEGKHAVQ